MVIAFGLMTVGLLALVGGGELLVRGAARLAAVVGVSPLVVGLTVVAFGTSAPELAVSVQSSLAGQTDLAVGNVVGSCIFNVLFILGVSALLLPLVVSSQLVRIDVPLMILASIVFGWMALDGVIGRFDGLLLFAGLLAYISWTVAQSRRESAQVQREFAEEFAEEDSTPTRASLFHLGLQLVWIVAGLALLTVGSDWLVDGAVTIARLAGMSELLIGLTIVAIGTSLPEVATSIMATVKGERDIAVGNVVGSNIFNILCVLGLTAAVVPNGVEVSPAALRLDIPVMIAVNIACLPIFMTGHLITRWKGGLFFGYYVAYTLFLVLEATMPRVSREWGVSLLLFVLPLVVVTLIGGVAQWLRAEAPAREER